MVAAATTGLLAPFALAATATAAEPADQPDCDAIWQREDSGFYEDNPTYHDPYDDSADWRFGTPESQHLDGALLNAGVDGLFENESLLSVIVIRNGTMVLERYGNGGSQHSANNIHSGAKSILQALTGIAIDQGHVPSLDTPASTYLADQFAGQSDAKKAISLRHLLTMRSGLSWSEDSTEYQVQNQTDWVRAIVSRNLSRTPGERFLYSTGNTHVVSGALQGATGLSTCEFAQQALFEKLNITTEHWGRDPMGVYSGGYNMYMTPREYAKFGLLYAQGGVWNGEQVVPAATVQEAFTETLPKDSDGFGYSSGWWTRNVDGYEMIIGWGWGGQFLYIIPELDLVFSTTQDTADEPFINEEINSGGFIRDHLIPAVLEEPEPADGEQQLEVVIPERTPEPGEFIWSIDGSNDLVDLGTATEQGDHFAATGAINPLRVTDTRHGAPAWSITGQVSDFTADGESYDASHLGWTPAVSENTGGAVAGAAVESGFVSGDGLSVARTLASAPEGHALGSAKVEAALDLRVPLTVAPGTYRATLTLTALG